MMQSATEDFVRLLDSVPITTYEREIIKARYVKVVEKAESDYFWAGVAYYILNNVVSIFGALIAALVPVTQSEYVAPAVSNGLYWLAFALAVMLTIANKWLLLFNVNSTYFVGEAVVEKYKSEGWMFLSGVGRYRKDADWAARVQTLCSRVEKIKTISQNSSSPNPVNDILAAAPERTDNVAF